MSWKEVLLTTGTKPPMVRATIKDDMLSLKISPEIAHVVGLTTSKPFTAFVGTAGEHGQIKVVQTDDGGGRVKGGVSAPILLIPAESSWANVEENAKCDFEITEGDETALIVNLPWYTGKTPEILHGNQKLTTPIAARMLQQYRNGVSRRRLAEFYGVTEQTVAAYTNNPEDVRAHADAIATKKTAHEVKALAPPTSPGSALRKTS
jgi:hypothetical protein